jgi:hypothetical protein
VSHGTWRRNGAVWALAGVLLLGRASAFAADDALERVRDALERGDFAAAAATAGAFIASSPGDPRLADAQRLLGLARERSGALGEAWQQYTLFLTNFPSHPARDDVAERIDRLVRHVRERADVLPNRWQPVPSWNGQRSPSGETALVVTFRDVAEVDRVAPRLTRAALDGARIWVRASLGAPDGVFDPFDVETVTRREQWFHAMASRPIEGFVIDGLGLGPDARPAAAARAWEELSRVIPETPEGRERLAWTWAGTRARASAAALQRFVAAAEGVAPRIGWVIRVSADVVLRPEYAVREAGEDWGELRIAAPRAVWAMDIPAGLESRLIKGAMDNGSRPPLARRTQGDGLVLLK